MLEHFLTNIFLCLCAHTYVFTHAHCYITSMFYILVLYGISVRYSFPYLLSLALYVSKYSL